MKSLHITTGKVRMPMITCEEPIDLSFLKCPLAGLLSDAVVGANVGEVRSVLDRRVDQLLLSISCGEGPSGYTIGMSPGGESEEVEAAVAGYGASILEHGSRM